MNCPACGKELGQDARTCGSCGVPLPEVQDVEFPQADRVPPMRLIVVSVGVMVLMLFLLFSALSPRPLLPSRQASREDPPVVRHAESAADAVPVPAAVAAAPAPVATPAPAAAPAPVATPAPAAAPAPVATPASAAAPAPVDESSMAARSTPSRTAAAVRARARPAVPVTRLAQAASPGPAVHETAHREPPVALAPDASPARSLDDLLK